MQNKLMNGLVAALMLLTVIAFAVPTATAHTGCAGLTPEQCGTCDDSEEHDHSVSYTGGLVKWCTWKPPPPAELIAELLRDGDVIPGGGDVPEVPEVPNLLLFRAIVEAVEDTEVPEPVLVL